MPFSTNNIQSDFGTPLSYLYVGPPQANTGFKPIVASVDTLNIYLSSTGSDANDGLTETTPKRTMDAAKSLLRAGIPDHIRVKCGDYFYGPDNPDDDLYINGSGRSSAEPYVVWWYGDENLGRPVFDGYRFQSGSQADMEFTRYSGIEIKNSQSEPDHANFNLTLSMLSTDTSLAVGNTAFVTLVGTDDVEVVASYVIQGGDTAVDIMEAVRTQLLGVVGCTLGSVEVSGNNVNILISRALAGRFYVKLISSRGVILGVQGCLIRLYVGGKTIGLFGSSNGVSFDDCVTEDAECVIQGSSSNMSFSRVISRGAWTPLTDTSHDAARSSNYFTIGVDGLSFNECVTDYGGYHKDYPRACSNLFSHCFYLAGGNTNDVNFTSNITTRGASHGAQLRSGGIIDNSFFGRNSLSVLLGWQGSVLEAGENAKISNSVMSEGISMIKGSYPYAFDAQGLEPNVTGAIRGLHFEDTELADSFAENCIVSIQAPPSVDVLADSWDAIPGNGFIRQSLVQDRSSAVITDFKAYHFESPTEGDSQNYSDPERTLGDYFDFLGGAALGAELVASGYLDQFVAGDDSFDSFMYIVKHRNLRKWDSRLTAEAINVFINEGYN